MPQLFIFFEENEGKEMPFCIASGMNEELMLKKKNTHTHIHTQKKTKKTNVKWPIIYSGHSRVVEQAQDECN